VSYTHGHIDLFFGAQALLFETEALNFLEVEAFKRTRSAR
jgi:hypothetical protein